MNSHIYNLQERTECTKTEPKLKLWVINYEVKDKAKGIAIIKARSANEASIIMLSDSQFNALKGSIAISRIEEVISDGAYSSLMSEDYVIYSVIGIDNSSSKLQADWAESNSYSLSYIKNKPNIPTKISELPNDSGYISIIEEGSINEKQLSKEVINKLNQPGYEPPKDGIPFKDLSDEVKNSLINANTAIQAEEDDASIEQEEDYILRSSAISQELGDDPTKIVSQQIISEILQTISSDASTAKENAVLLNDKLNSINSNVTSLNSEFNNIKNEVNSIENMITTVLNTAI